MDTNTRGKKIRNLLTAMICAIVLLLSVSSAVFAAEGNISPSHLYLIMQPGDVYRGYVDIYVDPPLEDQEGDTADLDSSFSMFPQQYLTLPYDPLRVSFLKAMEFIPVWAGETATRLEAVSVLPDTQPGEYTTHAVFPITQGEDYSENLGKQPITVTVIPPIDPSGIKMTGGGQVDWSDEEHELNSFGFNIKPDNTGKLSVNLEYNDNHYGNAGAQNNAGITFHVKINGYAVNPRAVINNITGEIIGVEFNAPATIRVINPKTDEVNVQEDINVYVKVTDEGEPGKGVDYFKIKFMDVLDLGNYTSEGLLDQGNIQLHSH